MKHLVFAVCAMALLVSGCTQTKKGAPKEGREAIQVRLETQQIEKETSVLKLGEPKTITKWNFLNQNIQNKVPHASISGWKEKVWKENVGKGISSSFIHLPAPVIHDGMIYTLDSQLKLTKTSKDGDVIWDMSLRDDKDMPAVASIGLAYDNKLIYVVSGDGIIYAVEPEGDIIWQKDTEKILRSSPVIYDNKLFVLSANNELLALSTKDGDLVWNYKNMETETNLLGMGIPAIQNKTIVVPFSNGEIIAFNTDTGEPKWSNMLLSYRTFNKIADLGHVLASPVIEGRVVYLIGNAHQMGAFHLDTGEEIFTQPIGGQTTPVISGDILFMITNKDTVVALNKYTGKLIWEKDLYSKTQKQVRWFTPVMANEHLLIYSGEGDRIIFNMKTGEEVLKELSDKPFSTPICYDNHVLIYTDKADLIMYR